MDCKFLPLCVKFPFTPSRPSSRMAGIPTYAGHPHSSRDRDSALTINYLLSSCRSHVRRDLVDRWTYHLLLTLALVALPSFAQHQSSAESVNQRKSRATAGGSAASIHQPNPSTDGSINPPIQQPNPSTDGRDGLPQVAAQRQSNYSISSFDISYTNEHPDLPSKEELLAFGIELGRTADGFTAPAADGELVQIPLSRLAAESANFSAGAVRSICQQIVKYFGYLQILGVYVTPDENHIEKNTGRDLRPGRKGALPLRIWVALVGNVRTVSAGARLEHEERTNNPSHDRIRWNSPIQPPQGEGADKEYDLLRRNEIDQYIHRLNRHPGRQVDVSIESAGVPGEVTLDYLVHEGKPWTLYAQASKTGTPSTSEWRERFGGSNNQFTDNDDILSFDYVTAGFDQSHGIVLDYEFPVISDRNRLSLNLSWNEYSADEVGVASEVFEGETVQYGLNLSRNIFQKDNLFIDLQLGARWKNIEVDNKLLLIEGETELFLPSIGLRLEKYSMTSSLSGSFTVEGNLPGVADTDQKDLRNLGRLRPNKEWMVMKWDVNNSFYLEPVLFRDKWRDPNTYKTSTLAHEFSWSFRGQYTADNKRLLSQEEATIGGFFSVRGYEESVLSGDNMVLGSAEYRFHVPRILKPETDPRKYKKLFGKPFRFAPPQVYGRPDWDFIVRAFWEIGRTMENDRTGFEEHHTISSVGVGFELQLLGNLTARVDWGYALDELVEGGLLTTERGNQRFHIMTTVVW